MNTGYPDQGSDNRLLPGLGWLQKALIIRKPAPTDVERPKILGFQVTAQLWPPFLMLERGTRQVRAGWCWRKTQGYYMPGLAFKHEATPEPDYTNAPDKN